MRKNKLTVIFILLLVLIQIVPIMVTAVGEEIIYSAGTTDPPKKVKITGSKYVAKGKKITLAATVTPSTASQSVKWTTSNKSVATVNSNGVVKGIKKGTAKITATSKVDPSKSVTWKITVKAKSATKVTFKNTPAFIDMASSKTIILNAKASPGSAAQSFDWKSSNTSIAKVNSSGKVTAKKTGTVTITATTADGSNKKASVTLKVINTKTGKTGANLSSLMKQNNDFVAWLTIPGTDVDYPVVWTNDINYYLDHTFEGKVSSLGTLFSLGKTDWTTPAKNLAIYGHDVEGAGKRMFKKLLDYKSYDFWKEHSTVYLDSIYRSGTYKIFAAFDITFGDFDPSTSTFSSNAAFLDFVNKCKSLSYYDTDVKVTSNSNIITMITCDRYFKRRIGRFVVMAVKTN